jgi:hypothetical protein
LIGDSSSAISWRSSSLLKFCARIGVTAGPVSHRHGGVDVLLDVGADVLHRLVLAILRHLRGLQRDARLLHRLDALLLHGLEDAVFGVEQHEDTIDQLLLLGVRCRRGGGRLGMDGRRGDQRDDESDLREGAKNGVHGVGPRKHQKGCVSFKPK